MPIQWYDLLLIIQLGVIKHKWPISQITFTTFWNQVLLTHVHVDAFAVCHHGTNLTFLLLTIWIFTISHRKSSSFQLFKHEFYMFHGYGYNWVKIHFLKVQLLFHFHFLISFILLSSSSLWLLIILFLIIFNKIKSIF